MRGRKVDTDFLSQFISECVNRDKISTVDILLEAKNQISSIDEKIKEVDKLRIKRGKLLDVVMTFEKPDKTNIINESKTLLFFKIQNTHICKFICDNMKNSATTLESLYCSKYSVQDIIFCVKQLLEYKVISSAGNYLLRGELFYEYLKFVLQEQ